MLKGCWICLEGLFVYGVQKEIEAFLSVHQMHFRLQKNGL